MRTDGTSRVFLVILLAVTASAARAGPGPVAASGAAPRVAVFGIDNRGPRLGEEKLDDLTAYLEALMLEGGYQVVGHEALGGPDEGSEACDTMDCRVVRARGANADLLLETRVLRFSGACRLVATLIDVGASRPVAAATGGGDCSQKSLLEGLEQVASKLHRKRAEVNGALRPAVEREAAEGGEEFTPASWGSDTGRLSLNAVPWGRVWIDGKDTGKATPLVDHELPAGRHRIAVNTETGEELTAMVEIWPDENTSLVLRSEPRAGQPEGKQGLLLLNTRPWSHVAVDGEHVGVTPVSQRLAPGRHAVKITFAHGEVIQEQIAIKAGETTKLIRRAKTPESFSYKQGMGLLKLHSSPWGRVWIDGRDVGLATPVFSRQLPPGKHEVTVYFSSGGYITEEIQILPGHTVRKIIREK